MHLGTKLFIRQQLSLLIEIGKEKNKKAYQLVVIQCLTNIA